MHCAIDDFTDGWATPEVVLMLHGIAETGDAFRGWVPHFARHYRVARPDLRGFGRSGVLAGPIQGVGIWADDIEALVRASDWTRVHVIGAKLGALIGMELARRRPAWMATLALAGLLISPGRAIGPWVEEWCRQIDAQGVESWARATMPGRMGTSLEAPAMAWWTRHMGASPAASVKACIRMVQHVGEPEGLEQFAAPTLVLVAGGESTSAEFQQRQPVTAVDALRARIPVSELAVIPATSYHVAATHPDACARRTRQFIETHTGRP